MPQYLSPGVYVEELPSSARPIAGVGTSTAGFIGVVPEAVTMPKKPNGASPASYTVATAGVPQLITSWEQFRNAFGDFQAKGTLADADYKSYRQLQHAVYGFFKNGGGRCWVIRVTDMSSLDAPLATLAAINEIAIVAAPGAIDAAQQNSLLTHCSKLKTCFAVLDGISPVPTSLTSTEIVKSTRSTYGAVYFPWLQIPDPITNATITVPPSGHVAGIYARTDSTRGVHKAPANEVVLGATGLERLVSKLEQDGLNPDGVNVIRSFDGTITVWGARTRADAGNSDFKYVSTRRLFIYLANSIDEGTKWVVFEPNTPALWQSITRNVTAFLTNVWRDGALFGDTPQQAFFVRCDASTNPPEQRDLGMVVTEVGVAIVRPAEFVIFRLSQWAGPSA